MKPRLGKLLGWAVLVAGVIHAAPSAALAPPVRGDFPAIVKRSARAGLFLPRRDPSQAPLLAERSHAGPAGNTSVLNFQRVPVALVDFPDQASRFSPDTLNWLWFQRRSTGPGTGSVRDYFNDISLGHYDLAGDVLHWYRSLQPKNFYAASEYGLNPATGVGHNAGWLVQEVAAAIDSTLDFSRYDLDGDGYVDALWICHSGQGGEYDTKDATNLWSHQSTLTAWGIPAFRTHTPWPGHPGQFIRINRYIMTPELSAQRPGQLNEIGNFCHEHGHTLGLPDLYDTEGAPFPGVGNWDLMAGGVYGGDGHHANTPVQMSSWSRARLGWLAPQNVSQEGPISLPPTETSPATLQLWSDGKPGSEYYLLENREPIGWDRYILGGGLLVWHIDEGVIDNEIAYNTVEHYPLFGVRLVEADGLDQLFLGINRGDAGDAFPGVSQNHAFDEYSVPASLTNQGLNPHVSLRGISVKADQSVQAWASFSPDRWLKSSTLPATTLNPRLGAGASPSVAFDPQGTLHVVWMEGPPGNLHVKYLERWHGLKWLGSPVQLDLSDFAFDPALASNSRGDLIAVWKQAVGNRSQLAAAFKGAGATWSAPQVLRDGPSQATGPTITTDSQNRFYVAWSERDSQLREHVRVQVYRSGQGWDPNSIQISGDSVTTQPVLTTDTIDRIHLAYLMVSSGPGGLRNLMHTFYPFNADWSPPIGPLAAGSGISQPMLAPMDSSRIALAWREPRGPVENVYFRVFDRTSWQSALGPAAVVAPSGWPVSMILDKGTNRLLFLWQSSTFQSVEVLGQEAGLFGPWDAGPHALAGSDSTSATSPLALSDPNGGAVLLWIQDNRIQMRARQGAAPTRSPPQILPLPEAQSHLGQNFPNPMRPRTRIPFEVPAAGVRLPASPALGSPPPAPAPRRVALTVHDVSGRRIRTLQDGLLAAGRYSREWDGRLEGGAPAPSGIYFYRLDLGAGAIESRKLLLVR